MSVDKIADAFGAKTTILEAEALAIVPKQIDEMVTDVRKQVLTKAEEDYEFTRQKLRHAIESCAGMLPGLVDLAKVAESPNMYQSAAGVFKVLSDMNNSLLENAVKMTKLTAERKNTPASVVQPGQPALPAPEGQPETPPEEIAFEGDTTELLVRLLASKNKTATVIDA